MQHLPHVVSDYVVHFDPANPPSLDSYERVVIYHGSCRDGWCAAWVAHLAFQVFPATPDRVLYVAGYYGQEPPWDHLAGKPVLLVDFSYKRDVVERLKRVAWNLTILDHHKTAAAELEGIADNNTEVVFDMNRSGAGIAWDHLVPNQPRPLLVNYVEDRDLWRRSLPHQADINAAIATLPFTFEAWTMAHNTLVKDAAAGFPLASLLEHGRGARAKGDQYVREVLKNAFFAQGTMLCPGKVVVVNAPQVDISELLHMALVAHPDAAFAVGWWQRGDMQVQVSLRSRQGGDVDVSEIATRFGGGGHREAAGFQVESPRLFFDKVLVL